MRIDAAVLSLSWIASEAVTGLPKQVFEVGVTHYDDPPPDRVTWADLEGLRADARFRFANDLRAWIEVQDGRIVDCGTRSARSPNGTVGRKAGREPAPAG